MRDTHPTAQRMDYSLKPTRSWLALLALLCFCHHAIAQPPSSISAQTLSFHNQSSHNQSSIITELALAPNQFALITLNNRGVTFLMELLDQNGQVQASSYREHEIFTDQLLLSGNQCQNCRVRISTQLPTTTDATFTLTREYLNPAQKERVLAEQTLQQVYASELTPESGTLLAQAIAYLESAETPQQRLRACNHKLNHSLVDSTQDTITGTRECLTLAREQELRAIETKLSIQLARVEKWFNDKNDEAIQELEEIIARQANAIRQPTAPVETLFTQGRALLLLGGIQSKLGRYLAAEQNLQQAQELFSRLGDAYNTAEALSELGSLERFRHQFEKATQYFEQAYQRSSKSLIDEPEQLLRIRYNMAVVSLFNGQYFYALKLLENITIETLPTAPIWKGHFYALQGRILLELARYDEAEKSLNQAWQTYEQGQYFSHLATVANNLSRLHTETGNPEQSEHFLLLANDYLGNDWGEEQRIRVLRANVNHYLANGEVSQALVLLSQLEKKAEKLQDPYQQGQVLSQKGEVLISDKRYAEALVALEQAIQLHDQQQDRLHSSRSHYLAAKACFYRDGNSSCAANHLTQAQRRIEDIRTSLLDDRVRQDYFALQKAIYEWAIVIQSQPTSADPFEALYSAESFRARTLFENLAGHSRSELSQTSTASWLQQSFAQNTNPATHSNQAKISRAQLSQFQQSLGSDEAILYFFAGDQSSYLWLVTQQSIKQVSLPEQQKLATVIEPLLPQINQNPSLAGARALWQQLFSNNRLVSELLLADITQELKTASKLTIIPDGLLHRVPFALLLDPTTDYRQPLVNQKQIQYASSIATAQWLESQAKQISYATDLLLVANPTVGQATGGSATTRAALDNFGSLFAAEEEAQVLKALWSSVGQHTALEGPAATKAAVLNALAKPYSVIHFASHASVNWQNPALSAIKLANDPQATLLESGDLSVDDITKLKLQANMVVLSACETGTGKLTTGEGPIGLSRAFFEAGVSRVLASLWPVDDRATAQLLEFFYQALIEQNQSPEQALQWAQQQMLRLPDFAHPYFWSGFIFVGDSKHWKI